MIPPTQLTLDLGHRPAMGMADFLVAESNQEAVAWLDRWPGWPGSALAIHGPGGCGKTHLTRVWAARSRAMLLQADALARTDLASLSTIRPAVVLDDADRISGTAAEEMLLHLYNLIGEGAGYLLLTGAAAPARWPLSLPDLTSRLKAIPAIAVGDPDDPLLAAVLVKLFADRQLAVGEEVITYLLPRIERSFTAARKLAAAIDEVSLAQRRPVTVPLVRAVLEELGLAG